MRPTDYTPGRALLMSHPLTTLPGCGLRQGAMLTGETVAIGATHSTLRCGPHRTEHRRPNTELTLRTGSFVLRAFRHGVSLTEPGPEGHRSFAPHWSWLGWTVDQHLAYEYTESVADIPLVLIGCGATKRDRPAPAAELYTGTYFGLALRAARALVPDDRIRIISALHGLLPLHRTVGPYDLRIGDNLAITPATFRGQVRRSGLGSCTDVTVLAGKSYAALARAAWPQARTPLDGTRGIGDQQHRLADIARGGLR